MSKVKIRIEIGLAFYNEYFIGGGKGLSNIDNHIIKDSVGRPYIPASTVKGRLRHETSRLYNSLEKDNKCIFFQQKEDETCNCLVCKMFGNKGVAKGELNFSNLAAEDYNKHLKSLYSVRAGVQINRYLGTTKDDALFFTETSGCGGNINFRGKIEGYVQEDTYKYQILLLYLAFAFIDTLGGNQSRGIGWIKDGKQFDIYVDEEKVEVNNLIEWGEKFEI